MRKDPIARLSFYRPIGLRLSRWVGAELGVLATMLLACCASPMPSASDQVEVDFQINQALSHVCPVASDPGPIQDRLRILRAQLVLASIAGYASRSIASYAAGDEVQADSMVVLQRLKGAGEELAKAAAASEADDPLLPLYRADLIVAAGSAADAALRPALRAAKTGLMSTSISSDTVTRAKTMLLNLLKDQLYLEALRESCQRLNNSLGAVVAANGAVVVAELPDSHLQKARKFADHRLKDRCDVLKRLAQIPSGDDYCRAQWP